MPLERIKTIVIFNKSYPGKASERSNSIIEQVDFLSISLLSVSSKDRDCLGSSVLPAPSWNFGANLIWKWGCALGQVSWPLCLFIFAFFAGSVRSLGRSWMNKTAEKKKHRKKHGMDFSAVWIIWNHVSLNIFDFKPVQVVELERQSPSKAVQDGTNNKHCHCSQNCWAPAKTAWSYLRVSMGLTDRRKTTKNLVDSRKNWKILTVSRK